MLLCCGWGWLSSLSVGEGGKVSGWQQRSGNVGQASVAHGCLEVSLSVSPSGLRPLLSVCTELAYPPPKSSTSTWS